MSSNVHQLKDPPGFYTYLGVFGQGTNVSLLLQTDRYFLPRCVLVTGRKVSWKVTLSEVNTGDIWTERANVSDFPDMLLPLQPPSLLSNMTGVYKCSSPSAYSCLKCSKYVYQLDVIGKTIFKFEQLSLQQKSFY